MIPDPDADPDPVIFESELQSVNKFRFLLHHFSKIKSHKKYQYSIAHPDPSDQYVFGPF
jgi:hypothetical protein